MARRRSLVFLAMAACTPSTPREPAAQAEPEAVPAAEATPEPEPEATPEPEAKPSPIDEALKRCEADSGEGPRYPEERTDLVSALDPRWHDVVPLVDTLATLRAKMGEPKEEEDLDSFAEPYPGDAVAKQPLLIYDHPGPWDVYVYLVRSDLSSNGNFHPGVQDRVGSIELLPEDQGPDLSKAKFGPPFSAASVMAADASWVDHRAPSGLTYSVYGSTKDPGRLQRVIYGPSDCQRQAAAPE